MSITNGCFTYKDANASAEPASNISASAKVVETPPEPATAANGAVAVETSVPSPADVIVENGSDTVVVDEDHPFELRDINVSFPVGKLTIISGPTSSGKSSLFTALLGEMYKTDGTVNLPKKAATSVGPDGLYDGVAFCAQLPWLQHASIRDKSVFFRFFHLSDAD